MITFWRMLRIQQLNCTFSLGHAMAINMQWSISQSSSVDHHRVPELGGVNQHRIRTSLTSRESFVHPVRGRAFRPRPRMPGVWQDLKVLKAYEASTRRLPLEGYGCLGGRSQGCCRSRLSFWGY